MVITVSMSDFPELWLEISLETMTFVVSMWKSCSFHSLPGLWFEISLEKTTLVVFLCGFHMETCRNHVVSMWKPFGSTWFTWIVA